jgi:serine/threonine protein kinase
MGDFVQRMRALRIGGRYQLVELLGEGSFGKVYLGERDGDAHPQRCLLISIGRDADTGSEVAIKLEHSKVDPSLLEEEIRIYKSLQSKPGFPRVFWHGWQDSFQVMVFELLGPNLEDLFCYCGQKFTLKTTLMLADQLLHRFESLHAARYLHRDVKPENFLLGTGSQGNTVYMTDLGLAIYRQPTKPRQSSSSLKPSVPSPSVSHEPSLIGTCRYASINAHLGRREYLLSLRLFVCH